VLTTAVVLLAQQVGFLAVLTPLGILEVLSPSGAGAVLAKSPFVLQNMFYVSGHCQNYRLPFVEMFADRRGDKVPPRD
jgi:hypothetical protein